MPVLATTAYPTAGECFSLVRSMVNDADIVATSTIPPTGVTRAANVVTVTTNAPHGLQINNVVQIASVSNTSFNGTQVVLAVPSPTTFQYAQTGPAVTSGNGVVQLLIQGDWATDNVLLPLANKAFRKVQTRLLQNGSPTASEEVYIMLPANTIQLNDSTFPQLPVDFLAPRTIEERIASGIANFGPPFYQPMTPVDELPSRPQGVYNGVYAWYGDGINFVGTTGATDIRLRYFVAYPDASSADSVYTIRGCQDCIADWTAFLATNGRGGTNAATFANLFEQDIKELLNMQAHARQYRPSRRKPNNYGRRGLYRGR